MSLKSGAHVIDIIMKVTLMRFQIFCNATLLLPIRRLDLLLIASLDWRGFEVCERFHPDDDEGFDEDDDD